MNWRLLPLAAVLSLLALWIWVPTSQLDAPAGPVAADRGGSPMLDVEGGRRAALKGGKRASGMLAPKPALDDASEAMRRAVPPPGLMATAALKSYVEVLFDGSGDTGIRAVEAYVRQHLEILAPADVVALLTKTDAPAAIDLVLRFVDRGLVEDRETWEDALFLGFECANHDVEHLAQIAELAEPRLDDPGTRAAAAAFLKKRAVSDRIRAVHARFVR